MIAVMSRVSLSIISILFFFCAYSVAADGDILEEVQSMDIFKLRLERIFKLKQLVELSCQMQILFLSYPASGNIWSHHILPEAIFSLTALGII